MIIIGSMQKHAYVGNGDFCPTLTEAMGAGGGQIPMIIEATALHLVRTEEGKKLRKQYEAHEIKHGFNEHRIYEPRSDSRANAVTTILKDNLILVNERQ